MKKELDVVAALIRKKEKVLLCQRKEGDDYGLLWEFPGGVVEENEDLKAAIEREIEEELGIKIKAKDLIDEFTDENENLKIKIFFFECDIDSGVVCAKDCQAFGFFSQAEVEALSLAPADIKIFSYLKKNGYFR